MLRRGDVLPQLWGDAGGPVPHHHPAHFNGGEQHRPVVGHGGGLVHRPVPHRHQRAHGHRFPVLGHRRGDCPGGGAGISGGGGQPVHRGGALRFLQAQVAGDPLHPHGPLRQRRGGEPGQRAHRLPGEADAVKEQVGGTGPGGAPLGGAPERGGRRLLRRAGAHGGREPGSAGLLQRGLHGVSHGHIKAWG